MVKRLSLIPAWMMYLGGMVDDEFEVLLEVADAAEGDDSGDGRALVVAPIAAEVVL